MNRRQFLSHTSGLVAAESLLSGQQTLLSGNAKVRMESDPARARISFLSWDTEGGDRHQSNLLRAHSGVTLRIRRDGQWQQLSDFSTEVTGTAGGPRSYRINIGRGGRVSWEIEMTRDGFRFRISADAAAHEFVQAAEMVFAFEPGVTPVTVLPSIWNEDESLQLPAVISAPDFGQLLLAEKERRPLRTRLEGSRKNHTVDFIVELPALGASSGYELAFTSLQLAAPAGLHDHELWPTVRRGWFNTWQPSSRWGEQDRPFSSPAGLLANNVISDPASLSIYFYSDMAMWLPKLAEGISVAPLVRRTVDWWLDHRTRANGEMVGYWDYGNFLDANASPVIGAWNYVQATGDLSWLQRRIAQLEFISDFLARRDVDGDGLVEATQSGNAGTLVQPNRSCAWWDALNCGHKDGYTNAVIFRSWCCLAALEDKLGRTAQRSRYAGLAQKLKASYTRALFNDKTGWLGWWRSADGKLHDYATPVVNGIAIEYGLVEPAAGREILNRLWRKIDTAGFKRIDLGIPCTLIPVHRSDYLLPQAIGCPRREDGTDTFGHYMNGGITAAQTLHFLAAHYVAGMPEKADAMLKAMLARQKLGKFQNGVRDAANQGLDWTTWEGRAGGYEGYLADVFYFQQAVLLREHSFRRLLYRPMQQ